MKKIGIPMEMYIIFLMLLYSRMILCDDLLKKLFKKDQIEMLEIAKDIQPHFLSPTEK